MAIPSHNFVVNCVDYFNWLQQIQLSPLLAPFPQSGGMFGGSVSNVLFPSYLSPLASPVSPGLPPAQPSPHVVGGQTFAGPSPVGSAFSPLKDGVAVARVPPFKVLESPRESPEIKKDITIPTFEPDSAAVKDEKSPGSNSGKFSVEFLCRPRSPLNLETLAEVSSSRFLTDFADVSGLNLLSEEAAKVIEKSVENPPESPSKAKIPCCKKHIDSPSIRGLICEDCIGSETLDGSPIPSWAIGMRASELELRLKLLRVWAEWKEKKKEYQSLNRESRKRKLKKAKIAKNNENNNKNSTANSNRETPKRRPGRKRNGRRRRFVSADPKIQENFVKNSPPPKIPVGLEAESLSDSEDEKALAATAVQFPEIHLKSADLAGKSARLLWLEHGLLYPAIVYPIDPPDIYQLRVEGQRQIRPHILCEEELLLNGFRDAPANEYADSLATGSRICSPWSKQIKALYPGKLSGSSSDADSKPGHLYIEFDDGDSGFCPIDACRMLPSDFPMQTDVQMPAFPEFFVRKRKSSDRLTDGSDRIKKSPKLALKKWTWVGDPVVKSVTGGKGKAARRNRRYYEAVEKGGEVVRVGDCVRFGAADQAEDYVGIIAELWEQHKGQMRVRVKWCYRPQDTKSKPTFKHAKHALFATEHADDNQIETIANRCTLLANYGEFRQLLVKGDVLADSGRVPMPTTYFLAGSYNPITGTLKLNQGLEFE